MPTLVSRPTVLLLLLVTGQASASPRDELLRFVPEDVGFCLSVQNLRGHLADLVASPFAEKFRKSTHGRTFLAAREWRQLEQVEKYLTQHLGIGWTTLRDDVLGDSFVFAYRPGPPDKPEQEQGLFLLRARNEKTLATLIQKLNALQKVTGELKALDEREHRGVKYHCRKEAKETNFYCLRGPVLLFTGQETLLRDAIQHALTAPADAEPAVARRLKEMHLNGAMVSLAVNPRAWDRAITARGIDPATKTVAVCWKALDAVGVGLHVEKDVRLSLAIKMRPEALPASARRFLVAGAKPGELWAHFPDHALLAVGGRLDLSALYEFLGEFMTRATRESTATELDLTLGAVLGKSVVKELLPAIGPDWGLCLLAPTRESKSALPGAVLAVKVARGDESDPIDQAVLSAVHTWAQLAILGHNKLRPGSPLSLRSQIIDRVRVRYLHGEGAFPEGVQPAFALQGSYLVVASSPGEIRRFRSGGATAIDGVPLLRMSLKDWRVYLEERRDALSALLAKKDGTTVEQAGKRIDAFRVSLELFDRVELRQQARPGLATFTLALQPSAAMKR